MGIKFSPSIQLFNTSQQTLTFHAIVVIQTNYYTYKNNSFFHEFWLIYTVGDVPIKSLFYL